MDLISIILQRAAPAARDLRAEERAECTIRTENINSAALWDSRFSLFRKQRQKHLLIQRRIQLEIEPLYRIIMAVFLAAAGQNAGDVYHRGALRDLMRQDVQILRMTDQLVDRAHAELRHDHAQLLCDKLHKVHDILRLAAEVFPQLRPLGRDAHRAGIKIAHAHHDAAEAHQRRGCKSELLRAEHTGNCHIAAGHKLAVCFEAHTAAQTVGNEALVRFGQTKLPRKTGIVNGTARGRAGSAVIAGNEHRLRACLGNACGNGTNARLGDELDGNISVFVGAFQIVDQLCQILDRVDIMVRRR